MNKAFEILAYAREELVSLICHESDLLCTKFGWEKDENGEIVIPASELCRKVSVKVEVDNSYLDIEDDTYEESDLVEIVIGEGTPLFVTEHKELSASDLSAEELTLIAVALEDTYNK